MVTTVPSMTDVARHAGVSQATVSNVLNYPQRVRPGTIERVEKSIRELGFVRNNNARALASGRNASIGLVTTGLDHSFAIDVAHGAQQESLDHGFQLLIAIADHDRATQGGHIDFFVGAQVTGILVSLLAESGAPLGDRFDSGIPTVVINFHDAADRCYVVVDNEKVGYLAARHMIELGCKRLLFVSTSVRLQQISEREAGVRRAVAEEDGAVQLEEFSVRDYNRADEAVALGHRIAMRPVSTRPDGVIGVTDIVAGAVIWALAQRQIAIPEEIAVMGCDANTFAWGGVVPLTTIESRAYDLGRTGVALLLEEAVVDPENPHVHRTEVLEPYVIPRESTIGRRIAVVRGPQDWHEVEPADGIQRAPETS